MNGSDGLSHTQIVMWTVGFFFAAAGVCAAFLKIFASGLRKTVLRASSDLSSTVGNLSKKVDNLDTDIDILKEKKLDVRVYIENKEAAEAIIDELQTRKECILMQGKCQAGLTVQLVEIKHLLDTVLMNQQGFSEINGTLKMVVERQKHVIDRIDSHMNGHKHNG